jgi:hypothetical protein
VVGKALKDWVTAVMLEKKLTRAEARLVVLAEIRQKGEGNERSTNIGVRGSQVGLAENTEHLSRGLLVAPYSGGQEVTYV